MIPMGRVNAQPIGLIVISLTSMRLSKNCTKKKSGWLLRATPTLHLINLGTLGGVKYPSLLSLIYDRAPVSDAFASERIYSTTNFGLALTLPQSKPFILFLATFSHKPNTITLVLSSTNGQVPYEGLLWPAFG